MPMPRSARIWRPPRLKSRRFAPRVSPPTGDCKAEAAALALGYQTDGVTAIDILLNPDATMMKRSDAVNARLRSVYPKGFALDATHRPHITLLQRFVRTADLDQVYAAANKVLAGVKASDLQLKAVKYYYIPAGRPWSFRHRRGADAGIAQAAAGAD